VEKYFDVKGMHCRSCEMLIKDSLGEAKGIKQVDVSHKSGKLKVLFDEKLIDEHKIKEIITKEGYKVI
jgi:copper chaperone CopZ